MRTLNALLQPKPAFINFSCARGQMNATCQRDETMIHQTLEEFIQASVQIDHCMKKVRQMNNLVPSHLNDSHSSLTSMSFTETSKPMHLNYMRPLIRNMLQ